MRATLIFPALFAMSLVGGVALAEKPVLDHPGKDPVMHESRIHGDMVDHYEHAGSTRNRSQSSMPVQVQSEVSGRPAVPSDARTKGDIVDRNYGSTNITKVASQRFEAASPSSAPAKPNTRAVERQHCSEVQDDCGSNRAGTSARSHVGKLVRTEKVGPDGKAKVSYQSKAALPNQRAQTQAAPSLSSSQAAALSRLLKAKVCAHAASGDGCGGDEAE